jgi:hypothetical protein
MASASSIRSTRMAAEVPRGLCGEDLERAARKQAVRIVLRSSPCSSPRESAPASAGRSRRSADRSPCSPDTLCRIGTGRWRRRSSREAHMDRLTSVTRSTAGSRCCPRWRAGRARASSDPEPPSCPQAIECAIRFIQKGDAGSAFPGYRIAPVVVSTIMLL